jgi:uncharacterized membrane protein
MFKAIGILLIIGFIAVLWYLVNVFSKPILNKMQNYYEDDPIGRQISNLIIGMIILLSILLGSVLF